MLRVRDVLSLIDKLAPFHLAESWDNVGLQTGDPAAPVRCMLVCLEITPAVVAEAHKLKANLIIAHHPLIFKPLGSLAENSPQTKMLAELIRRRIAVIAAHTNLDRSPAGVNAALAKAVGLRNTEFLLPDAPEKLYKLAVFTPQGHEDAVIEALHQGGAGTIGNYDHCTFRASGISTFRGNDAANPFLGQKGRLERAEEYRLETIVPQSRLASSIQRMIQAHPYEEVAYDIYPLENLGAVRTGMGMIGELPRAIRLDTLIRNLKKIFKLKTIQWIGGDPGRSVRRIACLGGAVSSMIGALDRCEFDALIAGEINHHAAQELLDRGRSAVILGHFASECPVAAYLANMLQNRDEIGRSNVKVYVAKSEKAPLNIL
ncbi:Nif3-like dinuclear metal center hexameric protein [Candidatus Sumerlaeota bacterium]|nr:Nif3-like dinuclear metal center hexameric protein [Candidatus Sumerlaeota bacterium]